MQAVNGMLVHNGIGDRKGDFPSSKMVGCPSWLSAESVLNFQVMRDLCMMYGLSYSTSPQLRSFGVRLYERVCTTLRREYTMNM